MKLYFDLKYKRKNIFTKEDFQYSIYFITARQRNDCSDTNFYRISLNPSIILITHVISVCVHVFRISLQTNLYRVSIFAKKKNKIDRVNRTSATSFSA